MDRKMIYRRRSSKVSGLLLAITALSLFLLATPLSAHADGGAPNLAYVAGTNKGISVIDIAQQKVTRTLSVDGDPARVLLSLDGRFLYIALPASNKVEMLAAQTGDKLCEAQVPGKPSILSFDTGNNTLYAAGNGAASVSAIDGNNCKITGTLKTGGPIYGLAVANVGSGGNGNQLWVGDTTGLTIFDSNTEKALASIPIAGGAGNIAAPPGTAIYVTTQTGNVDAVDLNSHHLLTLISGGTYGPMDFDEVSGKVYVPDMKNQQVDVLTPVGAGDTTALHEPAHVYKLGVAPQSVAITSDGQLGFVALQGGNVAMIDVPGEEVITTIQVGGNPHFIITGLYPPLIGNTPQQASIWGTVINVVAYVFVIALFIVPIIVFRRYSKKQSVKEEPPS